MKLKEQKYRRKKQYIVLEYAIDLLRYSVVCSNKSESGGRRTVGHVSGHLVFGDDYVLGDGRLVVRGLSSLRHPRSTSTCTCSAAHA